MNSSVQSRWLIKNVQILVVLFLCMGLSTYVMADGGGAYSIYDADRDGFLDQKEFEKFAESRSKRASSPDFWQFSRVDADGDQKISEQEMVNALMEDMKLKRQSK